MSRAVAPLPPMESLGFTDPCPAGEEPEYFGIPSDKSPSQTIDDCHVKGFVPTPPEVVDLMVQKLFAEGPPPAGSTVLDPGCGEGEFIDGILRACRRHGWDVPQITGVELDPRRAATAKQRFAGEPHVEIRRSDFLAESSERYDYIIANPPYVAITALSPKERDRYRKQFAAATGRFDLYMLFFEQALRLLGSGGTLVFITPEKFLYVESARPLRVLLQQHRLAELHFTSESTFSDRVTYPLITTIRSARRGPLVRVIHRNGATALVRVHGGDSWLPAIAGYAGNGVRSTLADVTRRISCGVATGADGVFVMPTASVPDALRRFAYPTISGRQISAVGPLRSRSSLLVPYDKTGALLAESRLGALGKHLREPETQQQLLSRTCVGRKPWYAFHDSFPADDLTRPKLLCKDIVESPFFVIDHTGGIVPRHSVYYIVPADPNDLIPLAAYLNSDEARAWLRAHCQRAANGFLRLQSRVLRQLPVPEDFRTMAPAPLAQAPLRKLATA